MKILVLGGTVFVGRHFTQAALDRGHQLTLFNRGQHNPELFPETEKLQGDRDGGLAVLEGHKWDAVVDTSGYLPRIVRDSAKMLSTMTSRYTFISSIAVYADASKPGIDEDYAVGDLPDRSVEEINEVTYGPLKAICEEEVNAQFPGRSLIVRPGLIVGPDDPTDRFTYWPVRAMRGGEILAPNTPNAAIQIIDVRDLSIWMIEMIEKQAAGVFNATGPDYRLHMSQFLEKCISVGGRDASITWVDEDFLNNSGVSEWMDLPLWLYSEKEKALLSIDVSKAIDSGLTFRSLEETIEDTMLWAGSRIPGHEWRAGLEPDREKRLLAAWHAR